MVSFYTSLLKAHVATDIEEKVAITQSLSECFQQTDSDEPWPEGFVIPDRPGLPYCVELVHPNKLKRRSPHTEKGRTILLHAIAHIEFNAINLALDAALRFPAMPQDYYRDWLLVAGEEAGHFELVRKRLADYGHQYGDFPAHNGLWDVAQRSSHDVLERMAVVPRVLEARGLDVTPAMRTSLEEAGDLESAQILDIIYRDEIGHVAIGTRWYKWLCKQRHMEPVETFKNIIETYYSGNLRGPFNLSARTQAGFDRVEMEMLESLAGSR
ncbi:MAG: uncharacterized ferritin-like protein (DUF455 family) [Parasphingorhabdus sp.]